MVELKSVYEATNIAQIPQLGSRALPQIFLDFLDLFFTKITQLFGIKIFFHPDDSLDILKINPESFKVLCRLRERGTIKQFSLDKKSSPDELKLLTVSVIMQNDQKVRGRSLFSYQEAWENVVDELDKFWFFNHFDVPVAGRELLNAKEIQINSDLDLYRLMNPSSTISPSDKFECLTTKELVSGQEFILPLQMFSSRHAKRATERGYEVGLVSVSRRNVDFDLNSEEAMLQTILKLIGRHSLNLYINKKILAKEISLEFIESPTVAKIKEKLDRYNFTGRLLLLESDFPVLVVKFVLTDNSGSKPVSTFGLSAGMQLEKCLESCFLQAIEARDTFSDIAELVEVELITKECLEWRKQSAKQVTLDNLLRLFKARSYRVFYRTIPPNVTATNLSGVVIRVPELEYRVISQIT